MKKFVFLYYGYSEPTSDIMEAWTAWFTKVGDHLVDSGNPFGGGREITPSGSRDLDDDANPVTGYSIVNAESIEEAEQLLDGLPIIGGVRIYEAVAM